MRDHTQGTHLPGRSGFGRSESDEARVLLMHVLSRYRNSRYVPTIVFSASDFYLRMHPDDAEVRELRRELDGPDSAA